MKNLLRASLGLVLLLLVATPVSAEVGDKIPAVWEIWFQTVLLGIAGFAITLKKWWAGIIAQVVGALLSFILVYDLLDPVFREDVVNELGESYVWNAYASFLAILATYVSSWIIYLLRRKKEI